MAGSSPVTRLVRGLALALAVVPVVAVPVPLDPTAWIDAILYPKPGSGSVHDEIQCYGLPYGGFGFLSHVLSYWTALCLIAGRKPIWPFGTFGRLQHSKWDMFVCSVSMAITVTLSAFTMNSCRNSWPFVLIALWKLTLSFSLNAVGLLASWAKRTNRVPLAQQQAKAADGDAAHLGPFYSTIVYWIGSVIGLVGVFDIVHQTFAINRNVRIVTGVLLGIVGAIVVAVILFVLCIAMTDDDEDHEANPETTHMVKPETKKTKRGFSLGRFMLFGTTGSFLGTLAAVGVAIAIAVFFSDWVLAAVQGNWAGAPSGDAAVLYWLYFAAKRLPMLAL